MTHLAPPPPPLLTFSSNLATVCSKRWTFRRMMSFSIFNASNSSLRPSVAASFDSVAARRPVSNRFCFRSSSAAVSWSLFSLVTRSSSASISSTLLCKASTSCRVCWNSSTETLVSGSRMCFMRGVGMVLVVFFTNCYSSSFWNCRWSALCDSSWSIISPCTGAAMHRRLDKS